MTEFASHRARSDSAAVGRGAPDPGRPASEGAPVPTAGGRAGRRGGEGLSHHILPAAGTMIGVCTTLIGLVKIIEIRIGPSHVDEYAALAALLFLVSAAASYLSMRVRADTRHAGRLERVADLCFMAGLLGLALIATLFAYETI